METPVKKLPSSKIINEKFSAAGWSYTSDNRSYYHKTLAALLDTGFIDFTIAKKGEVFVGKDGYKFNVRVSVKETGLVWRRRFQTSSLEAYDVLMVCATALKHEKTKQILSSIVDTDSTCQRCNGAGHIPQFHYYCEGICFGCYGLGHDRKFKSTIQAEKK